MQFNAAKQGDVQWSIALFGSEMEKRANKKNPT